MADPGAPFVTFYDQATGERVELSGTTFANWVAKTANLLVDEFDIERGDVIAISLPPHWLKAVWIAAAWRVGATIQAGLSAGGGNQPAVAVIGPDQIDDPPAARDVVACALRPLGVGFATPPAHGITDYSVEVRAHGDFFNGVRGSEGEEPALVFGEETLTMAQVEAEAQRLAKSLDLPAEGRLLVSQEVESAGDGQTQLSDWLTLVAVPRAVEGSVVIVRNVSSESALEHVAEQERTNARTIARSA